jgi:outer membrane receptor for ferrienterochelin and colicins
VDHLRSLAQVDVIQQGVQSTNVVVRGFNNIFSGALHTLTDHRVAGVPSLRVNIMSWVPSTDEDIERMELVFGPASALYGPTPPTACSTS